jgi:putative chitinase
MRAIDVVRRVCPRARPEYLRAFEQGDHLLKAAGITTPLRLAHFLAQVLHESGGLTIFRENMNYSRARLMEIFGVGRHSAAVSATESYDLAGDAFAIAERVYGIGNPRKAREFEHTRPGDGWKYRGGGILQTTGKNNYRRMGQKCGVDFEKHPELVYSAEHALKPALTEWTEGNCNAMADAYDLRGITRRINGGYNGLEDRVRWFQKLRPMIDSVEFRAPEPEPVAPPVKPVQPPVKPGTAVVGSAGVVAATMSIVSGYWPIGIAVLVCIAIGIYIWKKGKPTWLAKLKIGSSGSA